MLVRDAGTKEDRRSELVESIRQGRVGDAIHALRAELETTAGEAWVTDAVVATMRAGDLERASELARLAASLRFGSPSFTMRTCGVAPVSRGGAVTVAPAKVRHDLAQLRHLRAIGRHLDDADDLLRAFEQLDRRLRDVPDVERVVLDGDAADEVRDVYGRIHHWPQPDRRARALSGTWSRPDVERRYTTSRPGVVVVDDFLADDVVDELYSFCLESTIWSGERYAHGRLGSFLISGFNCPVLIQIAEELREALPDVIGDRYGLRQLWGFKNTSHLPAGSTIHADFAAVNVNFWLTPTDANVDPDSGGMVVYDVAAPSDWDFHTYNERLPLIVDHLGRNGARGVRIPYRRNRAVIFDSDLFHATEAVTFRPGYESHRVNVTMLFGERSSDVHHPPAPPSGDTSAQGWRFLGTSRRGPR
jgi:hypothetical protein